jgi:branched-chain amino acid transport system permease protein
MVWGFDDRGFASPIGPGTFTVLGAVMPWSAVWTVSASALTMIALGSFLRYSAWGLALRATAEDQEAALAQGIEVHGVFGLAWAISGILALVAGIFLGSFPRTVNLDMGVIALAALPAVIVGGFDSLIGAVVGGLLIGLSQLLVAGYLTDVLGGNLQIVVPYLIMLGTIAVRPYGLFGSRDIERV